MERAWQSSNTNDVPDSCIRRFVSSISAGLVAALFAMAFALPNGTLRAQDAPEQLSRSEPVLATDLFHIKRLGDVQVSPDGREVLYTVTSIVETDEEDSLAYRTHLFLADAGGLMPPRQLTRGPESALDPAWHPSGERIAFGRRVDDKPQIFVLSLLGGEAEQITSMESGASNPQWTRPEIEFCSRR